YKIELAIPVEFLGEWKRSLEIEVDWAAESIRGRLQGGVELVATVTAGIRVCDVETVDVCLTRWQVCDSIRDVTRTRMGRKVNRFCDGDGRPRYVGGSKFEPCGGRQGRAPGGSSCTDSVVHGS